MTSGAKAVSPRSPKTWEGPASDAEHTPGSGGSSARGGRGGRKGVPGIASRSKGGQEPGYNKTNQVEETPDRPLSEGCWSPGE